MSGTQTTLVSAGSASGLAGTPAARHASAWLFSKRTDLVVFLGSGLLSITALGVGALTGVLQDDSPNWAWVPAILLVDVAHVYATGFRVYLDGEEFRRRPGLYVLVPVLGLAIGVALYSESDLLFWRVLAYLAVFHFIRQQYGWVALYRARAGESGAAGKWIDTATIYLASVYPLVYWHAHLPREFSWFVPGDFGSLPSVVESLLQPVYWAALTLYGVRSIYRSLVHGVANPGKDVVVATTAACWYVGIVTFDSDYAFTVTNVFIHGIPYIALVYWYGRKRSVGSAGGKGFRLFRGGPMGFILILWVFAFLEEMIWDRGIWQERSWLFGGAWDIEALKFVVIPLLALPQITHYVLDGFIWRRKSNPGFSLIR